MKVGILGTGIVGRTIGAKLAELGHDVMIGTRDVEALLSRHEVAQYGESFDDWRARNEHLRLGTFAEAAAHGELVINATNGHGTLPALEARGIMSPFPVQTLVLPDASAGRDVMAKSRTGSGKTLAFAIPIVERLTRDAKAHPQALILVPTRELAAQVVEEFEDVARGAATS